ENWWPETRWEGPGGPSTEIRVATGPHRGCGEPDCGPACSCNRFVELWNLVFQMYTEAEDGALTPLPSPGVDTGMGFERLALILQDKQYSAETDEMWQIVQATMKVAAEDWGRPVSYGDDPDTDVALRVICDHVRGAAMITADGVAPSNEGAGYVLRRFLRRAYRFGLKLGADGPFMYKLIPSVEQAMGQAYPELKERQAFSVEVVRAEEEQFAHTLEQGLARLDNLVSDLKGRDVTVIPGDEAFKLYDTFGLPWEMTVEMAADAGLTVDEAGFQQALAAQRERSRGGPQGLAMHRETSVAAQLEATTFTGYDETSARATITALIAGDELVERLDEGAEGIVVLDVSPFYAERGGQIGDTGVISGESSNFEVTDTRPFGEAIAHFGRVTAGSMNVGDVVTAGVDEQRRDDIRRHHTATHLLHAALRLVLGQHVKQAGSLVTPDRLRFDFSHHQAITPEQIDLIEDHVNRWILADLPVDIEEMEMEDALEGGAVALFGEKYGEWVRTVKVADVSFELCGGTHCARTGAIGSLRIISESSVAAGTRRIEAVAGMASVRHSRAADALLGELSQELNCSTDEIVGRVSALRRRIRQLEKDLEAARRMSASIDVPDLVAQAGEVGGVRLVAAVVPDVDREGLKNLADEIVERLGSGVTVLGAEVDGKVALVAKVSEDVIGRGAHAGNLVRAVAERAGGGGGGAPNFAQAGGGDPAKLGEAVEAAGEILAGQLDEGNG
ncbi:MAG: alanine--tRNA ligase, partial [Armatimonadetes bacterium]|nr:alanine--tRNA ligase [Armatimonadota bacterium]